MSQTIYGYKQELINILRKLDTTYKPIRYLWASPLNLLHIGTPRYCAIGGIAKHLHVAEYKIQGAITGWTNASMYKEIRQKLGSPKGYFKCTKCEARRGPISILAHYFDHHKLSWGQVADEIERLGPIEPMPNTMKDKFILSAQFLTNTTHVTNIEQATTIWAKCLIVAGLVAGLVAVGLPITLDMIFSTFSLV